MCVVWDNVSQIFASVLLPFVMHDIVAEVFCTVVADAVVIASQPPVVIDVNAGNASTGVDDVDVANPLMVGSYGPNVPLSPVYLACLSLINSSAFAAAVGVNAADFVSKYPMCVSGPKYFMPPMCIMGFLGVNSTAIAAAVGVYIFGFVSKFAPMRASSSSLGSSMGGGVSGGLGGIVGPKFFVPPVYFMRFLGITAFAAVVGSLHTVAFASQFVPVRVSDTESEHNSYGSSAASRRNSSVRSSTVDSSVSSSSVGGCVGGSVRSSSVGIVGEGCWAEPLSLAGVCSEPTRSECVVGLAALAVGMGFRADGSYSPL
jgi:hypothetical protein